MFKQPNSTSKKGKYYSYKGNRLLQAHRHHYESGSVSHSYEYIHMDSPFFSSLSSCSDTHAALGAWGFGMWSGWQEFYGRTLHWSEAEMMTGSNYIDFS